MLQSSLKPGLLFHRCSSAYVTRFPVRCRTVSSADRQYVPRTSTSTPSTSKIRIFGRGCFFIILSGSLTLKAFQPAHKESAQGNFKNQNSTRPGQENSKRIETKESRKVSEKIRSRTRLSNERPARPSSGVRRG